MSDFARGENTSALEIVQETKRRTKIHIHKMIKVLLWFSTLTVALVNGFPFGETEPAEMDKIDISSLGSNAFGFPKESTGNILKNWNPATSKMNPEELGEYAQGDILFPIGMTRNGVISTTLRWSRGIIPYTIEGNFTTNTLNIITAAIDNYHKNTCIKFVKRTTEIDYIAITSDVTGCWSSIGKIGGRQQLNLQDPGCTSTKGVPEHEFYHAAGFFHEQSRSDRDDFVTINFTNIKTGMEHNFNKAADGTTTFYGVPYDYGSVMHYSNFAFSANGLATITPKVAGVTIGQRVGLSASDIKKINAMYKCPVSIFTWITNFFAMLCG